MEKNPLPPPPPPRSPRPRKSPASPSPTRPKNPTVQPSSDITEQIKAIIQEVNQASTTITALRAQVSLAHQQIQKAHFLATLTTSALIAENVVFATVLLAR